MLATDSLLMYATHLSSGCVDREGIDPNWRADRAEVDVAVFFRQAVNAPSLDPILETLAPQHPHYRALQAELARQHQLPENSGLTLSPGPALKVGQTHAQIPLIRALLKVEGNSALYDQALGDSVRKFQSEHGLDADGVIGNRTRELLGMSRADRILRLRANLERRRWLPRSLGSHHILVNIANYHVAVVANETAVMEMKAVVGRPFRQTPVFSAQMTYLVLSPFWHVPPSLASKDKLPILLKDPGKLADQGYRIFDGWGSDAKELSLEEARTRLAGAKRFPFRFRQDPGPKNALGDVKFMFPNSYNVYLHDTPDRNLFGKSERSFSSGCIRISRPIDLAEFLLSDQPGWSRERIEAAIAKRQEQTITLKQRYRVHLLYWTVAVKDDRVHVIPDIYERDGRLVTALKEVEEDPS